MRYTKPLNETDQNAGYKDAHTRRLGGRREMAVRSRWQKQGILTNQGNRQQLCGQ